MNREDLIQILKKSWDKNTCHIPLRKHWNKNNPEIGQCVVTVLVVQDYWGG